MTKCKSQLTCDSSVSVAMTPFLWQSVAVVPVQTCLLCSHCTNTCS